MSGFEVEMGELRRARAEVVETTDEVRAQQARIDGALRDLLASGWTGAAAQSYGRAWDTWLEGADAVTAGLQRLGDALDLAHRDYLARDLAELERLRASGSGLGHAPPRAGGGSGLNMGVGE